VALSPLRSPERARPDSRAKRLHLALVLEDEPVGDVLAPDASVAVEEREPEFQPAPDAEPDAERDPTPPTRGRRFARIAPEDPESLRRQPQQPERFVRQPTAPTPVREVRRPASDEPAAPRRSRAAEADRAARAAERRRPAENNRTSAGVATPAAPRVTDRAHAPGSPVTRGAARVAARPEVDAAERADVAERFARAASQVGPDRAIAASPRRRTVEITGHVAPISVPTASPLPGGRRRPRPRPADRFAAHPDRIALWAFFLGVFLIIVALLSG
jgi:hypothetical protein